MNKACFEVKKIGARSNHIYRREPRRRDVCRKKHLATLKKFQIETERKKRLKVFTIVQIKQDDVDNLIFRLRKNHQMNLRTSSKSTE
jgi:hypothetical protein